MNETDIDQSYDWMREERMASEHPFLPLTGDDGEICLRFEGPPEKHKSNFSTDESIKYEWRFTVIHSDPNMPRGPERKIITESSENFLAQVTKITQKGTRWNKLIGISWKKQKAMKSGRWFKVFEMVELEDPAVN